MCQMMVWGLHRLSRDCGSLGWVFRHKSCKLLSLSNSFNTKKNLNSPTLIVSETVENRSLFTFRVFNHTNFAQTGADSHTRRKKAEKREKLIRNSSRTAQVQPFWELREQLRSHLRRWKFCRNQLEIAFMLHSVPFWLILCRYLWSEARCMGVKRRVLCCEWGWDCWDWRPCFVSCESLIQPKNVKSIGLSRLKLKIGRQQWWRERKRIECDEEKETIDEELHENCRTMAARWSTNSKDGLKRFSTLNRDDGGDHRLGLSSALRWEIAHINLLRERECLHWAENGIDLRICTFNLAWTFILLQHED